MSSLFLTLSYGIGQTTGCNRPRPFTVSRGVDFVEADAFNDVDSVLELLFFFARESHDDIRSQGYVVTENVADLVDLLQILVPGVNRAAC